jgi:hypothetical protein
MAEAVITVVSSYLPKRLNSRKESNNYVSQECLE